MVELADARDSKSRVRKDVRVRPPPPAPRQKNSAPFRFRGLRKSRENCTSAESFFLSQIGPASLGSDSDSGSSSDLDCFVAPEKGKSCSDFPFSGAAPAARVDPLGLLYTEHDVRLEGRFFS